MRWFLQRIEETSELGRQDFARNPVLFIIEFVVILAAFAMVMAGVLVRLALIDDPDPYAIDFRPSAALVRITDAMFWIGLAILVAQGVYNAIRRRRR
jgi:hypothetical protein